VSDPESNPLRSLLSGIDLGPAWARGDAPSKSPRQRDESKAPRREFRERDERSPRQGRGGGHRDQNRRREGRRDQYDDRRSSAPQFEEVIPAPGVRVQLHPDAHAVHILAKEVHHAPRVHSLFEIAQILLAQRDRCRAVFEVAADKPALYLGKLDGSLWLTKDEAVRHFWQSEARNGLFDEEIVEVDPPSGNFQSVARCGLSGEWLGPPNFHSYQTNLRRLHRERFSHMPFDFYMSKVRTERGEEAVNAWLETTRKRTRWRIKGAEEDTPWIQDSAEAERAFATTYFQQAFEETHRAEISAGISAKHLSPSLLASLRIAGSHARKHPAVLIPAVCRMLEAEHLPVFKREGKLFSGPARPHPIAPDAILAERPAAIVNWLKGKKDPKLAQLWKGVLPEGTEEPPQEWLADLFWLLTQGHLLLYANDRLVMPERRQGSTVGSTPEKAAAPSPTTPGGVKKKRKRKPKKRKVRKSASATTRKLRLNPAVLRVVKTLPENPFRHKLRNRTLRRSQVLDARDNL
jgi:hypothetical protein